jgi:hypothetical protein
MALGRALLVAVALAISALGEEFVLEADGSQSADVEAAIARAGVLRQTGDATKLREAAAMYMSVVEQAPDNDAAKDGYRKSIAGLWGDHPSGRPDSSGYKFFLLGSEHEHTCLTAYYSQFLDALRSHPRRAMNPADASVIFVGFEHSQELNWPLYGEAEHKSSFVAGDLKSCVFDGNSVQGMNGAPYEFLRRCPFSKSQTHVFVDMGNLRVPEPRFHLLWNRSNVAIANNNWGQFGMYRSGIDIAFPSMPILRFDTEELEPEPRYLLTFKGRINREVREMLMFLHNGGDVIIKGYADALTLKSAAVEKGNGQVDEYAHLLTNTRFAVVAAGDQVFSYRFLEVEYVYLHSVVE